MALRHADIIRADQLSQADLELWDGFVRANPQLTGPYFDPRYYQAIGNTVPDAYIARLYSEEGLIAFMPFQRRGRVLQPFGAPVSDFHGLIKRPETSINIKDVLRHLKASRFEFHGWMGEAAPAPHLKAQKRLYADLSRGYKAYYTDCYEAYKKTFRNIERCQRNLSKDHPDLVFSWEAVTPEILDWVIERKRQQYSRTGLHDVFACGWTVDLLRDLAKDANDGFGLKAGVYRNGDDIAAAEITLCGGDSLHLWFPAYEPAYSRYGIGILLSLKILEDAAVRGVTRIDFGCGDEGYKSTMTNASEPCHEGRIVARRTALALNANGTALRDQLHRRLRVIRACETRTSGHVRAWWQMGRRLVQRARQSAAKAMSGSSGETLTSLCLCPLIL